DRLRRQHEFRPPALCRRTGGAGRSARGDLRGDDTGAAGKLPRVLRAAGQAQRDRIQLPLRRSAGRAHFRRRRSGQPARDRGPAPGDACAADRGLRPVRQRDGKAACASSGRRPRAGGGERNPLPVRVPGAAGGADALPEQHEPRLEHQPVPLPQPWRRSRARAGRNAGAARGSCRLSQLSDAPWLLRRRRDGQSGLPDVSRPLGSTRDPRARPLAGAAGASAGLTGPPRVFFRPRDAAHRACAAHEIARRGSSLTSTLGPPRLRVVTRNGSFSLKFASPVLQIAQKPKLCSFWQGLCSRHLVLYVANFRGLHMETIALDAGHGLNGGTELRDPVALTGAKVMVIDDSNTIRRSAEIFLLQAGCTVILAEDGFDALAKIADHQPDLIFVDIMMPRLDGYQTCALIKKNSRFHQTPVVMLSSKDGLFDRARGRMVGSDQYLTKPFTKESLLKAVGTHVKAAAHRAT